MAGSGAFLSIDAGVLGDKAAFFLVEITSSIQSIYSLSVLKNSSLRPAAFLSRAMIVLMLRSEVFPLLKQ
ncbi:Uncharacterised protein [Legionella pneumophila]|nr:Uncharacterised protein [Legionella pneumophila]